MMSLAAVMAAAVEQARVPAVGAVAMVAMVVAVAVVARMLKKHILEVL